MVEIEDFMLKSKFVNIDKENQMVAMYEMFMIIFVKAELAQDVSKVI